MGVSGINLLVIFTRSEEDQFYTFAICVLLNCEYMLGPHRIRRPLSTEILMHIRTLGEIMAIDRLKRGLGDQVFASRSWSRFGLTTEATEADTGN
jgi:hypothetical protein